MTVYRSSKRFPHTVKKKIGVIISIYTEVII